MSLVAAISINDQETILVTGERGDKDSINILTVAAHATADLLPLAQEEAGDNSNENTNTSSWEKGEIRNTRSFQRSLPLLGSQVNTVVAVASASKVLYKRNVLPFSDQKKIDQALPLQLQDSLPLDVDDFVIVNRVLKSSSGLSANGGQTDSSVLSALLSADEVKSALAASTALGKEARILSTRASALSALAASFAQYLEPTCGLLAIGDSDCSIVVLENSSPVFMRDIPFAAGDISDNGVSDGVISSIRACMKAAQKERNLDLSPLFIIGSAQITKSISGKLDCTVINFDLDQIVVNKTAQLLPTAKYFWAIGVIAAQTSKSKEIHQSLIDLRKGAFAYQPAWGNLLSALKEELFPIVLLLIFLFTWCASLVYKTSESLRAVDDKISQIVAEAIPHEKLPKGAELSEIEDRISKIEEQLRGIGSLSSLSPLDTLRELSQAIGQDIDIELDTMSIGHSRLVFRGTVPNHPTTGVLEEVLKKQKAFCSVNITPMGQGRTSRVSFSAEINICE